MKYLWPLMAGEPVGALPAAKCRLAVEGWRLKLSPATAYSYTQALRRLDVWVSRKTNSPIREYGEMPSLRTPAQRTVMPTEEETTTILDAADPPTRLVILLVADCGLRSGEAIRIAPAHFKPERGTITFRAKGERERTANVTDRVAALFALAPDTGELITPYATRLSGRSRFTFAALHGRWRKIKKRLGIRSELRIHDFRRRLATKAYEQMKDLRVPQQLLGHERLTSTLVYLAPFDTPKLKPLIEALRAPTRRIQ